MSKTSSLSASSERRKQTLVSLLIRLADRPGALAAALDCIHRAGVNLTHIESRPARDGAFDFFVDCEGESDAPAVAKARELLQDVAESVLVLGDKEVDWFPRHVQELDLIANRTLDAGDALEADHPGFNDAAYRRRRAEVTALAKAFREGAPLPSVSYSPEEHATWGRVFEELRPLHRRFASRTYLEVVKDLRRNCDFGPKRIPGAQAVSDYLQSRTGFRLRPVAGLLSARDFLNGLAFRVFFCTLYIRHPSRPLYTPEPDVCHELLGHAPMFADQSFADLSQEIGLASLGAEAEEIERLQRCYWHSVEFGLVREGRSVKAYGAGLLSSFGELEHACTHAAGDGAPPPEFKDWSPEVAAAQSFPITEYQPCYFIAPSLHAAKTSLRAYCASRARPFFARYQEHTGRVWVDRALVRSKV